MRHSEERLDKMRSIYERSRLRRGLRTALFVLPMMAVSFGCCGNLRASIVIAVALALLVTSLVWRGGAIARAVVPGYAAGIVPLVVPLVACPACERMGISGSIPLAACVLGGLVSGAVVVYYASREREDRTAFVLAGGAVAALAGSLGCVIVGLGGVLAMTIGLALVTPFALRNARAI